MCCTPTHSRVHAGECEHAVAETSLLVTWVLVVLLLSVEFSKFMW